MRLTISRLSDAGDGQFCADLCLRPIDHCFPHIHSVAETAYWDPKVRETFSSSQYCCLTSSQNSFTPEHSCEILDHDRADNEVCPIAVSSPSPIDDYQLF